MPVTNKPLYIGTNLEELTSKADVKKIVDKFATTNV